MSDAYSLHSVSFLITTELGLEGATELGLEGVGSGLCGYMWLTGSGETGGVSPRRTLNSEFSISTASECFLKLSLLKRRALF